mmetsp:Transcript_3827/g.6016  ORF Transcript_3827/g.6016 Transcript_3827/m.6016 type:complete len:179 (-) Transcript_3827:141-677(-)
MPTNYRPRNSISIGFQNGDIPIVPPAVAFLSCAVASLFAVTMGRCPFLPGRTAPENKKNLILMARIVHFVLILFIAKRIKAQCQQELEEVQSGMRFTPVHGLATTGVVYSRSRNPLYVLVVWIMLALAILVDSGWFLAATLVMWAYLQFWVIPVEEQFLKRKFGKQFGEYCAKTPRWV